MIILAIDHGIKNIGVAVCDELEIAARSLTVINHVSKDADADNVVKLVEQTSAKEVIVGVSYDEEGEPNESGRRSINFIEVLTGKLNIPVSGWDESLTTADAKALRLEMGSSKKNRKGHQDGLAAALLLQSFIDDRNGA